MSVLRSLFGPSRDEVWRKLSEELRADFTESSFWKGGGRVEVRVGEWIITLDTYTVSTGKSSVTYTRMRAPYVNADGFRFKVYREGFFTKVGKLFGLQDVVVGYPEFDRDFVIQGNHDGRLRELFAHSRIRELIEAQPHIHFEVKGDEGWFGKKFPQDVDQLVFTVTGVIKDIERLKLLFMLFAHTLNHLCHMGSAYEDDPEIRH
ncbi:MAG: DUF3137 domain-containing protein [Planctomycetota bacterium]